MNSLLSSGVLSFLLIHQEFNVFFDANSLLIKTFLASILWKWIILEYSWNLFLTKLSKKTFNIKKHNKKEKRAFQKVNTISCEKGVSSHTGFIEHQNLQRRFEKLKDKRMY